MSIGIYINEQPYEFVSTKDEADKIVSMLKSDYFIEDLNYFYSAYHLEIRIKGWRKEYA